VAGGWSRTRATIAEIGGMFRPMKSRTLVSVFVLILIGATALVWLSNQNSEENKLVTGIEEGRLKPCPNRENCRNSDDPQEKFQIAAINDVSGEKWQGLIDVMARLPRTKLVSQNESYRHFTQTSKLMRFVDDIEFHYRPEIGEIAVRSASRLGYRDFGVNEERIEQIRKLLDASPNQ